MHSAGGIALGSNRTMADGPKISQQPPHEGVMGLADRLNDRLCMGRELMGKLEDRLVPILRPVASEPVSSDKPTAPSESALVDGMRELIARAEQLNLRIMTLENRITL